MAKSPLRHAYLIIAHNNFEILEKLLRFLDGENTDFFLHIDAKVKNPDWDSLSGAPSRSHVYFVERFSIAWGDFSMVEAELALLKAAVPGKYDYYHLLSGVDVPIKSRETIEEYFEKRNGTNFIAFSHPEISKHDRWRVEFYFPFQPLNIRKLWLRRLLRNLCIGVQLVLGVDRTKKYSPELVFQKGSQWVDITHAFAEYILGREAEVREIFRATFCPDELFIHTLMVSSSFRDTLLPTALLEDGTMDCRYLNWRRGNPYVFTEDDFDELIHTEPYYLFARKFDYASHPGIVDRLFAYFGSDGADNGK